MLKIISDNIINIAHLCEKHKVKSLHLFGSAAKGDFKEFSDLDFLVHFSDKIDLLDYSDNYFDLLEGLNKMFQSDIDLISVKSLKNPYLIREIDDSKITLYES